MEDKKESEQMSDERRKRKRWTDIERIYHTVIN